MSLSFPFEYKMTTDTFQNRQQFPVFEIKKKRHKRLSICKMGNIIPVEKTLYCCPKIRNVIKNDQMSIFYQEKKREEKKIVLSSSPAEATIVRPSEKEEVIMKFIYII